MAEATVVEAMEAAKAEEAMVAVKEAAEKEVARAAVATAAARVAAAMVVVARAVVAMVVVVGVVARVLVPLLIGLTAPKSWRLVLPALPRNRKETPWPAHSQHHRQHSDRQRRWRWSRRCCLQQCSGFARRPW